MNLKETLDNLQRNEVVFYTYYKCTNLKGVVKMGQITALMKSGIEYLTTQMSVSSISKQEAISKITHQLDSLAEVLARGGDLSIDYIEKECFHLLDLIPWSLTFPRPTDTIKGLFIMMAVSVSALLYVADIVNDDHHGFETVSSWLDNNGVRIAVVHRNLTPLDVV